MPSLHPLVPLVARLHVDLRRQASALCLART
ncbi:putative leader peptide [Actinomadura meridiana]